MIGGSGVAILIARLAGVYPPRESYIDDKAAQAVNDERARL